MFLYCVGIDCVPLFTTQGRGVCSFQGMYQGGLQVCYSNSKNAVLIESANCGVVRGGPCFCSFQCPFHIA